MTYVQLAHNVWDQHTRYAKAQVLHPFCRTDDLDTAALKRFAKSISRFLTPEDAHGIQTNINGESSLQFISSVPWEVSIFCASCGRGWGCIQFFSSV